MTPAPGSPSRGVVLLNFAVFQGAWFACVLGAAHDAPWWGWLAAAVTVGVHLAWRGDAPATLARLLAVALLGSLGELALVAVGALEFRTATSLASLGGVPSWILALWLVFATTYEGCLAWLRARPLLAVPFGLVGSPLSYSAAVGFGALAFAGPRWPAAAWTGVIWAVSLPATMRLSARLEKKRPKPPPAP